MIAERFNFRDKIIFGTDYNEELYVGGIQDFTGLRPWELRKLIEEGLADANARHNGSPSACQFLEFIDNHSDYCGWFLNGFAESARRVNAGVNITGIESDSGDYSREDLIDFVNTFKDADDLDISEDELYCWYD